MKLTSYKSSLPVTKEPAIHIPAGFVVLFMISALVGCGKNSSKKEASHEAKITPPVVTATPVVPNPIPSANKVPQVSLEEIATWRKLPKKEFIWGDPPYIAFPKDRALLHNGTTDEDRAIGVCKLAHHASILAHLPEAHDAALELLRTEVIPNLRYCKTEKDTSVTSWRNVVYTILGAFGTLKARADEESFLKVLRAESPDPEDKNFSYYRLAYLYCEYGEYQQGIETYELVEPTSEFAHHREYIINQWKAKAAENENVQSDPKTLKKN